MIDYIDRRSVKPEEPEYYRPSDEERALGNVAIIYEKLLDDGSPDETSTPHVMPLRGVDHQISKDCWCIPRMEIHSGEKSYFHNTSQ